MIKRFSLNYALLSLALDAALTVAALAIAHTYRTVWLGWVWPEAWLPGRAQAQAIPPNLWLWVVLLWQGVFAVTSVYDPRRNYRAVDEFQTVALAEVVACLALAGLLYLSERAVARWLFVFYLVLNVVFLLGWRVIARIAFRLLRGGATPQRVLIVGAGEVGQRVAETIAAHGWTGLTLVGYLDDDPAPGTRGLALYLRRRPSDSAVGHPPLSRFVAEAQRDHAAEARLLCCQGDLRRAAAPGKVQAHPNERVAHQEGIPRTHHRHIGARSLASQQQQNKGKRCAKHLSPIRAATRVSRLHGQTAESAMERAATTWRLLPLFTHPLRLGAGQTLSRAGWSWPPSRSSIHPRGATLLARRHPAPRPAPATTQIGVISEPGDA